MQLAQHLPTEQLVAIKFLRRGGTLDPRLIAREVCASRKSSPGFVADFATRSHHPDSSCRGDSPGIAGR